MGINIGNNNKFKNTNIVENSNDKIEVTPKAWYEKHPILIACVSAVIAGVILSFGVWEKIVYFMENLF